jgi:pimeloyl-ACP methyl ester carboxylesterase
VAARFLCLLVIAAVLAPGEAKAAVPLAACGTSGAECAQVQVPVDRNGLVPGTISLHVEVLPAASTPARGTIFLIAGGPGQGSAHTYDLGSPDSASFLQAILPGYTLVAVDNRGTGSSGLINCPELQRQVFRATIQRQAALARACADLIGAGFPFYSTRDHADDLEAVRQALGLGKVGLYGVSYGTKLALAYALAYPSHVDRIALVSVLPVEGPDVFARDVLPQMPKTLADFCAGGRCRGVTSNYAGDVVGLANKLEAHPLRGRVVVNGKAATTIRISGEDLLNAITDTDLIPGLAQEFPAAVHAARKGYNRPLLRLVGLDSFGSTDSAADLSAGLYAATTCDDGVFPWSPATPVSERAAILSSAVNGLPLGALGPFGQWASNFGTAAFCEQWPTRPGQKTLPSGPYPNVPVLIVSGGLDLRTPTAGAAAVLQHFPQGRLLVVPGVGHDPVDADLSLCAAREVRYWALGLLTSSTCPRAPSLVRTVPAFPRVRGKQSPRSTRALAAKTVTEAQAVWAVALVSSGGLRPAGLYGGSLAVAKSGLGMRLVRYSIAPGIQVSGRLTAPAGKFPLNFSGTVKVSGRNAAHGTLRVAGKTVSGVLGGRRVAGRSLSLGAEAGLVRQGSGSASTVRSGFPAAWPRFPLGVPGEAASLLAR